MKNLLSGLAALTLVMAAPAAYADDPLFTSDNVLKIRIDAPFKDLIKSAKKTKAGFDGNLTVSGETALPIELSPRGKSRRTMDLCKFPPLRVKFKDKPGEASVFDGQKSLKLVTHCQSQSKFQQYALLEYSIYKMYNALTPQSLKVRLAEVEYFDSEKGKSYITRYGFFIEDMDDAAKRNGMKEIDIPKIKRRQLDPNAAARASLFSYMIGNLDYAMTVGPDGSDCCHNGKLMGQTKTSADGIVFVPYDFDQTGFINTPYAAPPSNLNVRSVKTRLYRGFCFQNENAKAQVPVYLQKESALKNAVLSTPNLDAKSAKTAIKFLDGFFKTLRDPEAVEKKILAKCRG